MFHLPTTNQLELSGKDLEESFHKPQYSQPISSCDRFLTVPKFSASAMLQSWMIPHDPWDRERFQNCRDWFDRFVIHWLLLNTGGGAENSDEFQSKHLFGAMNRIWWVLGVPIWRPGLIGIEWGGGGFWWRMKDFGACHDVMVSVSLD